MRERDFRNNIKQLLAAQRIISSAIFVAIRNAPSLVAFLFRRWRLMQFPNIVLPTGPMKYADVSVALEQAVVTWKTCAGFASLGRSNLNDQRRHDQ